MVDNQHTKIKGYRDLTQSEIDFMNEIKAAGEVVSKLITKAEAIKALSDHLHATGQQPDEEFPRAVDLRWLSIAKTDLQKGFMSLVRSVAQPESF